MSILKGRQTIEGEDELVGNRDRGKGKKEKVLVMLSVSVYLFLSVKYYPAVSQCESRLLGHCSNASKCEHMSVCLSERTVHAQTDTHKHTHRQSQILACTHPHGMCMHPCETNVRKKNYTSI